MGFKILIFILMFSLVEAQTSESECQPVGLKSEFGPVRSQGNMGWCYANAAADLLSFHYRDELKGQAVSAAYIALKLNYSWWAEEFREGGLMYFALHEAMESGLCPKFYDDQLMRSGTKTTLKEKLQFILDLKDKLDAGHIDVVKTELQKSYTSGSVLKKIKLYDLLTIMALSPKNKVLGNIADALCGQERHQISRFAKREFSTKYLTWNRWNLIHEINDNLNRRNPVGVAYFASFFDQEDAPKTNDSRHMSVVVDREYNYQEKKCEFWIRNSWGSHCGGYKNPKMQARCRNGYVLVPEDILKEYIYALSFLEK